MRSRLRRLRNTYRWSSLGQSGDADAYAVRLGITFAAQYRFIASTGAGTGWQSLAERALTWGAAHQVREAQAVLTRP